MFATQRSDCQGYVRLTGWRCPICRAQVAAPIKCILGGGCLVSIWDGLHYHGFCNTCNYQLLYHFQGEVYAFSYSRLAAKSGGRNGN